MCILTEYIYPVPVHVYMYVNVMVVHVMVKLFTGTEHKSTTHYSFNHMNQDLLLTVCVPSYHAYYRVTMLWTVNCLLPIAVLCWIGVTGEPPPILIEFCMM